MPILFPRPALRLSPPDSPAEAQALPFGERLPGVQRPRAVLRLERRRLAVLCIGKAASRFTCPLNASPTPHWPAFVPFHLPSVCSALYWKSGIAVYLSTQRLPNATLAGVCSFPSAGAVFVVLATSLAVVTLKTSSTVVIPIRTNRHPSSANVRIPARRAASRIRSLEAFLRMSWRISLSVSIHSKIACRPRNPVCRHSRQPTER